MVFDGAGGHVVVKGTKGALREQKVKQKNMWTGVTMNAYKKGLLWKALLER